MSDPILVEVTRGPLVESVHRGIAVIVDADGAIVHAWGDAERLVYPRSANKPMQALPLVESGAADRWGLTDRELALSCASHKGEAGHVSAVRAWLAAMSADETMLECGTHWPGNEASTHAMVRAGEQPTPAHNNCSGKHSGFVATALHLGERVSGYVEYDHEVQRRLRAVQSDLCGFDLDKAPWGYDGCGIPTLAMPLKSLALGMARLADPSRLAPARADAARRLVAAMGRQPFYVSGSGEFTTLVMERAGGRVVVKPGAEGVFTAALPGRGWGIAIKCDDGAGRGAEQAMAGLLVSLGILGDEDQAALAAVLAPELRNRAGRHVGALRTAPALAKTPF